MKTYTTRDTALSLIEGVWAQAAQAKCFLVGLYYFMFLHNLLTFIANELNLNDV